MLSSELPCNSSKQVPVRSVPCGGGGFGPGDTSFCFHKMALFLFLASMTLQRNYIYTHISFKMKPYRYIFYIYFNIFNSYTH